MISGRDVAGELLSLRLLIGFNFLQQGIKPWPSWMDDDCMAFG